MADMLVTGKRPAVPWKIGLGILLLLTAAANSVRPTTGNAAGALGALATLCLLVFLGARLIASGVPKTLGNDEFKSTRRAIWYRLMVVGFLVMAASSLALAAMSYIVAGTLIVWGYWFVWTWMSWRIADAKALARLSMSRGINT